MFFQGIQSPSRLKPPRLDPLQTQRVEVEGFVHEGHRSRDSIMGPLKISGLCYRRTAEESSVRAVTTGKYTPRTVGRHG